MIKLNAKDLLDHFHDSARKGECDVCNQNAWCLETLDLDYGEELRVCHGCAKTDFVFFHNGKYFISDKSE